ncbi:YaiI/YqxD family protein [Macrococcus carouselicus]|uniref:UPF0178 protein ERX40_00175 n=1 Tax=Macrococcus carouselicus TaxID=69969 RepID=A0A9Q8FQN1_9STAP|nr:YaiI/YqxD family protein [Macrococcus carouselicus]TDM03621.1 YaiI/YqxD family protein [Macrococcus carouselicus]
MILVDADACPVIEEIIEVAGHYQIEVRLVRNFNHFTSRDYPPFVSITYVDDGLDSADYRIVALVKHDDIVITQDYGLASLLLKKHVTVLHQSGKLYSDANIDLLLEMRHISQQMRKSGLRTKGPKAFSQADRQHFKNQLKKTIRNQ